MYLYIVCLFDHFPPVVLICSLCGKIFPGPGYVRRHILYKVYIHRYSTLYRQYDTNRQEDNTMKILVIKINILLKNREAIKKPYQTPNPR